MTMVLPHVIATPPSDSELMVMRLFKVTEILSRKQTPVEEVEFFVEKSSEKYTDEEFRYPETNDKLNDA